MTSINTIPRTSDVDMQKKKSHLGKPSQPGQQGQPFLCSLALKWRKKHIYTWLTDSSLDLYELIHSHLVFTVILVKWHYLFENLIPLAVYERLFKLKIKT